MRRPRDAWSSMIASLEAEGILSLNGPPWTPGEAQVLETVRELREAGTLTAAQIDAVTTLLEAVLVRLEEKDTAPTPTPPLLCECGHQRDCHWVPMATGKPHCTGGDCCPCREYRPDRYEPPRVAGE